MTNLFFLFFFSCFFAYQLHIVTTGEGHDDDVSSGSEAWEERESSRTHSVKFSEDSGIADKDTPFVRQNTPHPKELKLKAHKLFAKEKTKTDDGGNLDTLSEEVSDFFLSFVLYSEFPIFSSKSSSSKTYY